VCFALILQANRCTCLWQIVLSKITVGQKTLSRYGYKWCFYKLAMPCRMHITHCACCCCSTRALKFCSA
jgi:hypothetical protein